MRLIRSAFKLALVALALTCALVAGFTWGYPAQNAADLAPTDAIVCLGGGMSADGTLHPPTIARVERCVALYQAGLAPRVHFTGGARITGGPAAGERMAALAINLGLPPEAASTENRSRSTLQNALYSQPMLQNTKSLRLVTEAFHLPRAWASFRVFGPQKLHLTFSERIRQRPGTPNPEYRMLVREVAAWGFNTLRLAAWSITGAFNFSTPEARNDWLS